MNIGALAKNTGVSAKMIRHYERLGLIPKAERSVSNYRTYSQRDVQTLRFIRRARDLGFSLKQIESLLDLWRNPQRTSAEVKALANQHIEQIQQRISQLEGMRSLLQGLMAECHGDQRSECPILDGLIQGD